MTQEAHRLDVLMADDEQDICEVLKDGLAVYGISVRTVGNGREAVLEALRKKPDAVLMDILMPVLRGTDALGLFKIIEPIRTVPVLMLTALKNKQDVINAMLAGAADYIAKPFDLKDTATRIRRVLARFSPAPSPVFHFLHYQALSDGKHFRIRIESDLTPESADDLGYLIRALKPIEPIRIELDFEQVFKIDGNLVSPMVEIKEAAAKDGGEMVVTNFDPKRYRMASNNLIRNLFKVEEAPAAAQPAAAPAKAKPAPREMETEMEDKILADVLTKLSGLRYEFAAKGDYSDLEFHGDLTAENREKVTEAFEVAATGWLPVLIQLDGVGRADGRAMNHLVQKLTDFKQKTGMKVFVIVQNDDVHKALHAARGHLVAGVYENRDKALAALRSA